MIQANYEAKSRELWLVRVGEHRLPHFICTLFDVEVRRESTRTLSVFKDSELIGILHFDEAGYGIPVKGEGAKKWKS